MKSFPERCALRIERDVEERSENGTGESPRAEQYEHVDVGTRAVAAYVPGGARVGAHESQQTNQKRQHEDPTGSLGEVAAGVKVVVAFSMLYETEPRARAAAMPSSLRFGLRKTEATGVQLRVARDQRAGCLRRARS